VSPDIGVGFKVGILYFSPVGSFRNRGACRAQGLHTPIPLLSHTGFPFHHKPLPSSRGLDPEVLRHRQIEWAANSKTTIDVRATCDGIEMEVFLNLL